MYVIASIRCPLWHKWLVRTELDRTESKISHILWTYSCLQATDYNLGKINTQKKNTIWRWSCKNFKLNRTESKIHAYFKNIFIATSYWLQFGEKNTIWRRRCKNFKLDRTERKIHSYFMNIFMATSYRLQLEENKHTKKHNLVTTLQKYQIG